ncbi:ferredoxin family protein [Desulfoscipio sp. XC116]|uniref:DUF362 domain-containing protein n=1 Tax=Desulfoscipio sp. XC116 TaxID=3144975 RepID=UPI00325BC356
MRFDGHRHNSTDYIAINTRLCKACWKCVSICPGKVLGKVGFFFHKHVRIVNSENCTGCGACAKTCPEGAIMLLKQAPQFRPK